MNDQNTNLYKYLGDEFLISSGFIKTPEGVAVHHDVATRVITELLHHYMRITQRRVDQENEAKNDK